MILTLSLTPSLSAYVAHHADAQGLSAAEWVRQQLESRAGLSRPSPWDKPTLASDELPAKDRAERVREQAFQLAKFGRIRQLPNPF